MNYVNVFTSQGIFRGRKKDMNIKPRNLSNSIGIFNLNW